MSSKSQYGTENIKRSGISNNPVKGTYGLRVLEEVQAGSLTEGVFEYNFQIQILKGLVVLKTVNKTLR